MGLIRLAIAIVLIGLASVVLFDVVTMNAERANRTQLVAAPVVVEVATTTMARITGEFIAQDQGGRSVPYVLYEINGAMQTKALAFDAMSDCGGVACSDAVRAYRDTPIAVTGTIVNEHILVRLLTNADNGAFTVAAK